MTTYKRHVPRDVTPPEQYVRPQIGGGIATHKTSAAAAFSLVFGVAALFSVATAILSFVGLVFGVVGTALGIIGLLMARRPGVTGKGVATGGLALSILAILISLAFPAGVSTYLNDDEEMVGQLQQQVDR
jgi:hypothetical protein